MSDTLYIDSTDLGQFLTPISFISGFVTHPALMGQDYYVPGYVGVYPAGVDGQLGKGPQVVQFGGLIVGDWDVTRPAPAPSRSIYLSKLAAFTNLVYNDAKPFTLRWQSGDTLRSTTARYLSGLGPGVGQLGPAAGRVAVDVQLINPIWTVQTVTP